MDRDHGASTFTDEGDMGGKPSHAIPSNRPESGGANRDDVQEKSGLLDREKEEFAKSEAAKREQRDQNDANDGTSGDAGELND
jgi:hypothetical protein